MKFKKYGGYFDYKSKGWMIKYETYTNLKNEVFLVNQLFQDETEMSNIVFRRDPLICF